MSDQRVIGTETEYGIYRPGDVSANAVAMSTQAVQAYGPLSRGPHLQASPVEWDYRAEDPLNDLRGRRLDRAAADPSLLTDDPYHLAPPGGQEQLPRPEDDSMVRSRPTSMVLANGARLYVDHAHPEYSGPEVANAIDAVQWDRAGDLIAQRIMEANDAAGGEPFVLVKNNVDGKGATYGSHENYQVDRMADLDDVIRVMIPFLVTRPIICGSGRVGIGQTSETAGFQISQRADYVENDVGLETTFNRPIFNTRDEPHADGNRWRRIHVIGGDANLFDVSILLRTGATALVLWAAEQGIDLTWEGLDLLGPIGATKTVSRDLTLTAELPLQNGGEITALDLQQRYLDLVVATFERVGKEPSSEETLVLRRWQEVLDGLRADIFSVATQVEWVAKYQLFERQRERLGVAWDDARLAAMDVQWGDLRPSKSLVAALDRAGLVERLCSPEQIAWAADNPPENTRAALRGAAVSSEPDLVQASWTSMVYDDPGSGVYRRIPIGDPSAISL